MLTHWSRNPQGGRSKAGFGTPKIGTVTAVDTIDQRKTMEYVTSSFELSSKTALVTHDEKLALVAIEMLDDSSVLRVEDVIAAVYLQDPTLKDQIERAIDNLNN